MKQAEKPKARRSTSKQTSINMTREMRDDFVVVATAKFGPRGQARWIENALREFTSIPDFAMRVGASEANVSLPAAKAITLTQAAEDYLTEGVLKVRRLDPGAENVRAQILRAAIANQIRKEGLPKPEPAPVAIADARPKLRRSSSRT